MQKNGVWTQPFLKDPESRGGCFRNNLKYKMLTREVIRKEIFYFDFKVPAGFPSPAMDYMQKRIDLNEELIKDPLSTFFIECEGTSMIDAFIPPKAKLLIDRSINPKNVKCWLVPANKKYQEIEITEDMNFTVWGVVISIIVNPNDVRCLR
jgi:DNA polymerase V